MNSEFGMGNAEGGRLVSGVRTEDRGQRPEGRRQRTENGRGKREDGMSKA